MIEEFMSHGINVSRVYIKDEEEAKALEKPIGRYTTLKTGPLNNDVRFKDICNCLSEELSSYLTPYMKKPLCICGIGNSSMTADALGPETIHRILPSVWEAFSELYSAIPNFDKIVAFCPGVKGETNLSTRAAVSSIAHTIDAACVLTVDATVCSGYDRLCSTIQIADSGMRFDGSKDYLSLSTIGIPVISIGVPTIIRAGTLSPDACNGCDDFLTVSCIANVIKDAAFIIACSVLRTAYSKVDYDTGRKIINEILL